MHKVSGVVMTVDNREELRMVEGSWQKALAERSLKTDKLS